MFPGHLAHKKCYNYTSILYTPILSYFILFLIWEVYIGLSLMAFGWICTLAIVRESQKHDNPTNRGARSISKPRTGFGMGKACCMIQENHRKPIWAKPPVSSFQAARGFFKWDKRLRQLEICLGDQSTNLRNKGVCQLLGRHVFHCFPNKTLKWGFLIGFRRLSNFAVSKPQKRTSIATEPFDCHATVQFPSGPLPKACHHPTSLPAA